MQTRNKPPVINDFLPKRGFTAESTWRRTRVTKLYKNELLGGHQRAAYKLTRCNTSQESSVTSRYFRSVSNKSPTFHVSLKRYSALRAFIFRLLPVGVTTASISLALLSESSSFPLPLHPLSLFMLVAPYKKRYPEKNY